MQNNKLKTPSGFRDLLPKDALEQEYIIEKIRSVYKRFGFLPFETPVAEFENILISEGVTDFNLYRLQSTSERLSESEKEQIALRFDLTVPLARAVSQYGNELSRPFKRYQMGYVFRGERPQKGRYRQFMQFDADIVGTKNLVSDAEMISMVLEIMKGLEISDFVVRVNTRTILNVLPTFASFPNNVLREVLIILDKIEKISEDEFVSELKRLRIHEDGINKIKKFATISGNPLSVLKELENLFVEYKNEVNPGLEELRLLASYIETLNLKNKVIFDMKIIRGFGYYTGPVFETNLLNAPEFGSVISGGRYDNLVERFTNQTLPAVGMSVGVDRFHSALQTLGILKPSQKDKKIVVFSSQQSSYSFSVAIKLREKGFFTDFYVGNKKEFKDIINYAENLKVGYLVIIGTEEEKDRMVSIKNIKTREQKTIPFNGLELFTIDF